MLVRITSHVKRVDAGFDSLSEALSTDPVSQDGDIGKDHTNAMSVRYCGM